MGVAWGSVSRGVALGSVSAAALVWALGAVQGRATAFELAQERGAACLHRYKVWAWEQQMLDASGTLRAYNQTKRCSTEKRDINSAVHPQSRVLNYNQPQARLVRKSDLPASRPRIYTSHANSSALSSPKPACVIAAVMFPRSFIPWRPFGMVFTRISMSLSAFSPCRKSVLLIYGGEALQLCARVAQHFWAGVVT